MFLQIDIKGLKDKQVLDIAEFGITYVYNSFLLGRDIITIVILINRFNIITNLRLKLSLVS